MTLRCINVQNDLVITANKAETGERRHADGSEFRRLRTPSLIARTAASGSSKQQVRDGSAVPGRAGPGRAARSGNKTNGWKGHPTSGAEARRGGGTCQHRRLSTRRRAHPGATERRVGSPRPQHRRAPFGNRSSIDFRADSKRRDDDDDDVGGDEAKL